VRAGGSATVTVHGRDSFTVTPGVTPETTERSYASVQTAVTSPEGENRIQHIFGRLLVLYAFRLQPPPRTFAATTSELKLIVMLAPTSQNVAALQDQNLRGNLYFAVKAS
jgi:hypothetical protein